MAMRVIWTNTANRSLEYIFTCSQDFYSRRMLKNLNRDIKHAEMLLSDNPYLGAIEPIAEGLDFEYRHVVLSKPFKLIYFIFDQCLYVADIWDVRQSPDKLMKHLS